MPGTLALLMGQQGDPEGVLAALRSEVLPTAVQQMNEELLPFQFALYDDDRIPTNQRNLTDVRTRMGVLLEYELAKAINQVLVSDLGDEATLTYVIANRYPDLAFRGRKGEVGVRFEVKAIETAAEEKSANFDTTIKDIREGTDFVVVLIWEWVAHKQHPLKHPAILDVVVMDAHQLAQMRDTYWLNRPPTNPGDARQGFDLCYGVNCSAGNYNKEEGNYGKLMRVFDPEYEKYLPGRVKEGTTLGEYYRFRRVTTESGLKLISQRIAYAYQIDDGASRIGSGLPVVYAVQGAGHRLLIIGDSAMPNKKDSLGLMKQEGVDYALLLNGKFDWKVRDRNWGELASGKKPAEAEDWAAAASRKG